MALAGRSKIVFVVDGDGLEDPVECLVGVLAQLLEVAEDAVERGQAPNEHVFTPNEAVSFVVEQERLLLDLLEDAVVEHRGEAATSRQLLLRAVVRKKSACSSSLEITVT